MKCRSPYMVGVLECPCGGCLPCRINRRRLWAHRILLESYKHGDNCFVTLTYDDSHVPDQLIKADYQNWIKRLRRAISPKKIRYFIAGEYGELTGRPHFHAAIFGLDRWTAGGSDGSQGIVQEVWERGFTGVGELNAKTASYVAGYLTKKVVQNDGTRAPQFCRMSLRPGIGATAMGDIGRALSQDAGLDSIASTGDVPAVLCHGRGMLPLGRYLRSRLRGELGFASKDTPPAAARMFVLRKAAEDAQARASFYEAGFKAWDCEKMIIDTRNQKINNALAKFRIRDQKRKLI